MTHLTPTQRAGCVAAAAQDLPLAVWREPGAATFTVLISWQPPELTSVFDGPDQPGFVMANFQAPDGNKAFCLNADVLIDGRETRFWDGQGFVGVPLDADPKHNMTADPGARVQSGPANISDPQPTPRADYMAKVARAVVAIKSGLAEKIVLSRIEPFDLPFDHDLCDFVGRLAAAHPHAFVSLVRSTVTGTWLTATPEVLLTADETEVRTMALAGTQWPDAGTDIASLAWPQKIVA